MKESELIEKQEESDNLDMYLIKVGMFYHAYNAGAYAIAKLMHYKVRKISRKYGDVLTVGFPSNMLDTVISKIKEVGGILGNESGDLIKFYGIDNAPDLSILGTIDKSEKQGNNNEISEVIRNFDLINSSPMDAINFISLLKNMLK